MPTKRRFVVVTTEHKGVFAGYLASEQDHVAKLTEAQMCVYWSQDVKGVVGLAASGPSKSCKVSAPAPAMTLNGVTAVIDCTEEAAAKWQQRPWS